MPGNPLVQAEALILIFERHVLINRTAFYLPNALTNDRSDYPFPLRYILQMLFIAFIDTDDYISRLHYGLKCLRATSLHVLHMAWFPFANGTEWHNLSTEKYSGKNGMVIMNASLDPPASVQNVIDQKATDALLLGPVIRDAGVAWSIRNPKVIFNFDFYFLLFITFV